MLIDIVFSSSICRFNTCVTSCLGRQHFLYFLVLKSSKEVEKDSAENPRSLESTGGAT